MSTKSAKSDEPKEKEKRKPVIIKNTTDLQRLKLEKLMKNPDKLILLPEKPKEKGIPSVPDFVRNVMGSSAGAGSGEFHVYRHLRRKEYARQKFMKEKGEKERLDDEYQEKIDENKRKLDEKTAKKRAKRLKRKQNMKKKPKLNKPESSSSSSEELSEEENDEKIIKESVETVSENKEETAEITDENVSISSPEIKTGTDKITEVLDT